MSEDENDKVEVTFAALLSKHGSGLGVRIPVMYEGNFEHKDRVLVTIVKYKKGDSSGEEVKESYDNESTPD